MLEVSFGNYVGLSPTISVFLYASVQLETFSEGNCLACEYVCACDTMWCFSHLASGVGWSEMLFQNVQL